MPAFTSITRQRPRHYTGQALRRPLHCPRCNAVPARYGWARIIAGPVEPKDFGSVVSRIGELADAARDPAASGHLRALQAALDAIGRGDLASVFDNAIEDVTLDIYAPPEFPFVRTARGAGPFRAALEHNFGAVHEQRPEVRDLFADGDRIVLLGRETGVIRQSGRTYDVEFVERFTFRDSRLASVQIIAAYSKPSGD